MGIESPTLKLKSYFLTTKPSLISLVKVYIYLMKVFFHETLEVLVMAIGAGWDFHGPRPDRDGGRWSAG